MNIDLVFNSGIKDYIKKHNVKFADGDENLLITKGFTTSFNGDILINLGATQWKMYEKYGEHYLIFKIIETINHETMHLLIDTGNNKPINYTYDGEEWVCRMLAGQI